VERSSGRIRIAPEIRAYMQKIDAYRGRREPIRSMRGHAARLERAVRGLSPARLSRRPARGKWSIAEILGHLVDTEVVYGYRLRKMIATSGRPMEPYDQDVWTDTFRGRRSSVPAMLRQIRLLREVNLDLVTRIPRVWWSRYGMHGERGKETVRRQLELLAGHDWNHLDQIMAIRKSRPSGTRRRARRSPARRRAAA